MRLFWGMVLQILNNFCVYIYLYICMHVCIYQHKINSNIISSGSTQINVSSQLSPRKIIERKIRRHEYFNNTIPCSKLDIGVDSLSSEASPGIDRVRHPASVCLISEDRPSAETIFLGYSLPSIY